MKRMSVLALSALLLAAGACDSSNKQSPEEMAKVMQSKLADADAMIRNNEVADAKTLAAWMLFKAKKV